jgi:hypothetical protein
MKSNGCYGLILQIVFGLENFWTTHATKGVGKDVWSHKQQVGDMVWGVRVYPNGDDEASRGKITAYIQAVKQYDFKEG